MPTYRGRQQAELDASPQECFAALTDYEALPRWQRAVCRARVVESRDAADLVEYEVDAKVTTLRYRLWHSYEPPRLIDSAYAGGSLRSMGGRWTFEPAGAGRTRAVVEIEADPGRWVPGPVKRAIEDALLRRAIEDLRVHVEGS
jgi:ribosome-associated toxin RatA of RatAB toxin-antitoxin module